MKLSSLANTKRFDKEQRNTAYNKRFGAAAAGSPHES
jgi:hypothetical protein